jgi:hypothetical protein
MQAKAGFVGDMLGENTGKSMILVPTEPSGKLGYDSINAAESDAIGSTNLSLRSASISGILSSGVRTQNPEPFLCSVRSARDSLTVASLSVPEPLKGSTFC